MRWNTKPTGDHVDACSARESERHFHSSCSFSSLCVWAVSVATWGTLLPWKGVDNITSCNLACRGFHTWNNWGWVYESYCCPPPGGGGVRLICFALIFGERSCRPSLYKVHYYAWLVQMLALLFLTVSKSDLIWYFRIFFQAISDWNPPNHLFIGESHIVSSPLKFSHGLFLVLLLSALNQFSTFAQDNQEKFECKLCISVSLTPAVQLACESLTSFLSSSYLHLVCIPLSFKYSEWNGICRSDSVILSAAIIAGIAEIMSTAQREPLISLHLRRGHSR